jgi:protein-S-isoprenylcysteine O-methyltransferase Ste14
MQHDAAVRLSIPPTDHDCLRSRRNSTPAPPKSLKLFGIMHDLGSVHALRQPPSRFMVTAAPAAHLRNVGREMEDLNKNAIGGLLRFLITLAVLLFLAAWTLDYWQAWVFLAVFSGSALAITLYLMKNDPKLLERRMKAGPAAEKEKSQKIIQIVATASFISAIVFPAVDHRFGWSAVPAPVAIAGDVLVALGFLVIFFVFKENTFTSGVIEVDADQKVISTGPYALVRHPMYSGALIMLAGVPLALGSWWGLAAVALMVLVIIWRLLDEERFLAGNLPGYSEYQDQVRYCLVPLLW